jgi:predicted transcriptional regulator
MILLARPHVLTWLENNSRTAGCQRIFLGYASGMKTAVSIPDDVFEGAERLARRTKKSRSRLFSDALTEFLERHAPEEITKAMNHACEQAGDLPDDFVSAAARRALRRSKW